VQKKRGRSTIGKGKKTGLTPKGPVLRGKLKKNRKLGHKSGQDTEVPERTGKLR